MSWAYIFEHYTPDAVRAMAHGYQSAFRAPGRDVTTNVKRLPWWRRDIDVQHGPIKVWRIGRLFVQFTLQVRQTRFSFVVSRAPSRPRHP